MATFAVVILTASPPGQSSESGGALAKIDGREILLRTVELFLNRDNVKQVQVIFMPDFLDEAKRKFGNHFGFSGVKVAGGGPGWIEQIVAATQSLPESATHVLVHDAARPAVPYNDIEAIMSAAEKDPIVALVAPVRAGLVEVDEGGSAMAYHRPSRFMQLLTPQSFRRDKFLEVASKKAEPHPSELTLLSGSGL
ncbi:MAG: IspD/TarI family cytidylyltransferase, partial [Tepidisphaeraceae bacterium]